MAMLLISIRSLCFSAAYLIEAICSSVCSCNQRRRRLTSDFPFPSLPFPGLTLLASHKRDHAHRCTPPSVLLTSLYPLPPMIAVLPSSAVIATQLRSARPYLGLSGHTMSSLTLHLTAFAPPHPIPIPPLPSALLRVAAERVHAPGCGGRGCEVAD